MDRNNSSFVQGAIFTMENNSSKERGEWGTENQTLEGWRNKKAGKLGGYSKMGRRISDQ